MYLRIKNIFLAISVLLIIYSCNSLNDGVNENPNDIVLDDVSPELFLTGGLLANVQLQCGVYNNVSALFTGQLIGFASVYSNQYNFNVTAANSNSTWNALYVGVVTNMKNIQNSDKANDLLKGISKVVEAHAVGTGASLWGSIPYSESANPDISDPKFDGQKDVFNSMIDLLDDAISDLNNASTQPLSQDIHFNGDKDKWVELANTLKARYYLQLKDYPKALTAAQSGISSADGDMRFTPTGDASIASGDKNLLWTAVNGSRGGDIGNTQLEDDGSTSSNDDGEKIQSYLLDLLESREHSKTEEDARFGYYQINTDIAGHNGVIGQFEPQNMATFFETELIKAECAARAGSVSDGLPHLNKMREWLSNGGNLNSNYSSGTFKYDAFVEADFANGGIENTDNIDPTKAFLREVIEERYVSGFRMYMPFNDARRLRKSDSDISVDYTLFNITTIRYPERFPYADDEINANPNTPSVADIFVKTEVNE